jgi:DNA-binding LacI/PurR family transcriptional regulator
MHSFFVEIIAGIEPVASARGYGLLLCSSGEDPRKERGELEMLRSRQVDGVILASSYAQANTEMLLRLTRLATSLVMIDRDDYPSVQCHRVLTDDERVGVLATSHLIDVGCQAIAHIGGPPIVHAKRREQGWREALTAHGFKPSDDWILRGGFMESDGYRAMKRLLTVRPRIDAVFAANDPAAIGAMKAIWDAGLHVPEDIAVVGAGDIAHGDFLRVPLTTVGWSRKDLGRHAAELLLRGVEEEAPGEPQRVIIPPRLIVRESCGAGHHRGRDLPA